jgi:hypothetical protein
VCFGAVGQRLFGIFAWLEGELPPRLPRGMARCLRCCFLGSRSRAGGARLVSWIKNGVFGVMGWERSACLEALLHPLLG